MEHLPPLEPDDHSHEGHGYIAVNQAFCDAMIRAIRAGLERPPMIGIDHRPGTRNPLSWGPHRPRP